MNKTLLGIAVVASLVATPVLAADVPVKAFSASKLLALARWNSARAGVISAKDMGSAFTWMRPDDLVWKAWVNNYLMGLDPSPFDILFWNADSTNLPAKLHAGFMDIMLHNPLLKADALKILSKASKAEVTAGAYPPGLTASALYLASVLAGENLTQYGAAVAAGVAESTVRKENKLLRKVMGM